jgi:hypothetical protein
MKMWRGVCSLFVMSLFGLCAWSGCASDRGPDVRGDQATGYVEPEPGDTTESDSVRPQVPKMY